MGVTSQEVQNGIDWLNRNHPGWLDKINVDKLDQTVSSRCVLGQLHHGENGWDAVLTEAGLTRDQAVVLGFDSVRTGDDTEPWRSAILAVRAGRASTSTSTSTLYHVCRDGKYLGEISQDFMLELVASNPSTTFTVQAAAS